MVLHAVEVGAILSGVFVFSFAVWVVDFGGNESSREGRRPGILLYILYQLDESLFPDMLCGVLYEKYAVRQLIYLLRRFLNTVLMGDLPKLNQILFIKFFGFEFLFNEI